MASELVRHALDAAVHPQERQKSKAVRALQLVAESHARKLERLGGLHEGRCGFCNCIAFLYERPAVMLWRCRKCKSWNRIHDVAG